jgi:hypothetical protein
MGARTDGTHAQTEAGTHEQTEAGRGQRAHRQSQAKAKEAKESEEAKEGTSQDSHAHSHRCLPAAALPATHPLTTLFNTPSRMDDKKLVEEAAR